MSQLIENRPGHSLGIGGGEGLVQKQHNPVLEGNLPKIRPVDFSLEQILDSLSSLHTDVNAGTAEQQIEFRGSLGYSLSAHHLLSTNRLKV